MPNTNQYHLRIDISGLEDNAAVAQTKPEQDQLTQIQKKAKGLVSYAAISGTAQKLISNHISLISESTGAVEYEQKIQAVHNIAFPVASSILGGLLTGNVGVALFGLAISAGNMIWDIAQKQRRINIETAVEDVGIQLQSRRVGTSSRREK